jgi:hypothetical protein
MVAFIRQLPTLDPQAYQELVASSGGHSHGGGESTGHSNAEGEEAPHEHAMGEDAEHEDGHLPAAGVPVPEGGTTHVHADGMSHVHTPSVPQAASTAVPADDGHDDHDHQD